eukprot:SM000013S26366  [mRNA]  locus=s13:76851:79958:+ [translate_table: standard]
MTGLGLPSPLVAGRSFLWRDAQSNLPGASPRPTRQMMCDLTGTRFPAVRETLRRKIGSVYKDMDLTLETFPADDVVRDECAYLPAMATMRKGSVVIIFTPDNTHFDIAMAAVRHGEQKDAAFPGGRSITARSCTALLEVHESGENKVLVSVEFHKRFDPIYADARDRVRSLGHFSYFSSTMCQPKKQLTTFAGWAGKSSDISYYLNSHHIDFHAWSLGASARPVRVVAMASSGVAQAQLNSDTELEDTITLLVQWINAANYSRGCASYTASWIAPPSDCHTQQHFHYMGQKGEVHVDQAHRGYTWATDTSGYGTLNPLYMKYTPDCKGYFAGQLGYGYRSISLFLAEVEKLVAGSKSLQEVEDDKLLGTIHSTLAVTAILEVRAGLHDCAQVGVCLLALEGLWPSDGLDMLAAVGSLLFLLLATLFLALDDSGAMSMQAGRRSLDLGGEPVCIIYDEHDQPLKLQPVGLDP